MNKPRANDSRDQLPADLLATDAALSDLAAADRAGAPAGLEGRIFAASRGSLPLSPGSDGDAPPAIKIARHRFGRSAYRIAAAAAVLAAIGAAWLAQRPAYSPWMAGSPGLSASDAALVHDVDTLILATALFDNGLGEEIDMLYADTADADQRIDHARDPASLLRDWGSM